MPRPGRSLRHLLLGAAVLAAAWTATSPTPASARPAQDATTTTIPLGSDGKPLPNTSDSDPWVLAAGVIVVTVVGALIVVRVRRSGR